MQKLEEYPECPELFKKKIDFEKAKANGWGYQIAEDTIILFKLFNEISFTIGACWNENGCRYKTFFNKGEIMFAFAINLYTQEFLACSEVPEILEQVKKEVLATEIQNLLPIIIGLGILIIIGISLGRK